MEITAFGRTLSLAAWVEEPICVVGLRTLERRVLSGWRWERALTSEIPVKRSLGVLLVSYRGVQWEPGKRRYAAFIRIQGRLRRLGRFVTPEEAARAYNRALRGVNSPDRQGFNLLEPMF